MLSQKRSTCGKHYGMRDLGQFCNDCLEVWSIKKENDVRTIRICSQASSLYTKGGKASKLQMIFSVSILHEGYNTARLLSFDNRASNT